MCRMRAVASPRRTRPPLLLSCRRAVRTAMISSLPMPSNGICWSTLLDGTSRRTNCSVWCLLFGVGCECERGDNKRVRARENVGGTREVSCHCSHHPIPLSCARSATASTDRCWQSCPRTGCCRCRCCPCRCCPCRRWYRRRQCACATTLTRLVVVVVVERRRLFPGFRGRG